MNRPASGRPDAPLTIYLDPDLALLLDNGPRGELTLEGTSALRLLARLGDLVLLAGGSSLEAGRRLADAGIDFRRGESLPASEDFTGSFAISDDPAFFAPFAGSSLLPLFIMTPKGLPKIGRLDSRSLLFHTLLAAAEWIEEYPRGEASIGELLDAGAAALMRGELAAFPTETVYGLGADALNEAAVRKIFAAKQRPLYDPLIVHIGEAEQLDELADTVSPSARRLVERFWPGPLTLVLPKRELVPDIVTAGHPTVAVRMPANPWGRELIRRAGVPVAAPSANLFGRTSPTTAAHVADQLAGGYSVLIDAGACRVGVESTVLSLAGERPHLLRAGGVSREEIEAVIGPVAAEVAENDAGGESPGMLPSHYAPLTKLLIVDDVEAYADRPDTGCILYRDSDRAFAGPTVQISRGSDVGEIAVNIYAALRNLDTAGVDQIVAEWCPEGGIGTAVNDRLRKASARR